MADDEPDVELEPGDFLYQGDQELFLVVMGETDDGYRFAVHGWREISEERLDSYLEADHSGIKFLHEEDEIAQVIEEEGDEDMGDNFEQMRELFGAYADAEFDGEGPHTDFALEDT